MTELIQFNQLTTSLKSMESINSDERYFEGLLTVQMKDKQGEVTIVDELYKVLPIWMDRGAPISDTHTNRIIGKGINYSKTIVKDEHGESFPAIKITGKIYKNYELDNVIWDKIRNKEYRGLSFGGATRSNRTPMRMKDGSMAYALSNLEHYEVAVCKDPAVPLAVITDFNPIAKASFNSEVRDDGKMVIRCTDMGCYVEKSEEVEKVERSKPFSQFGSDLKVGEKTPAEITPNTKFFGADGKSYKTPELAAKAPPRKRRNVSAERKARADYKAQAGVSIGDRLAMRNNADLNESQTFQEKVDALVREGKSEESAKKIVGSFVHKELLIKAGYQTEAGNTQLGGQASTEDDKEKREKEDEEKENDEVKRRDHSDAGGDIHSMYNQNVGREASSGRKLKGDTTVNQTGGIRKNSAGTYIQGSGKTNDINPVQKKPERNEEILISNIKVVKNINNSLLKHAQTQELKKVKDKIKTITHGKRGMEYPEVGDLVWDSKQRKHVIEDKKAKLPKTDITPLGFKPT